MRIRSMIAYCGLALGGAGWYAYSSDAFSRLLPPKTDAEPVQTVRRPVGEVGALGWLEPAGGVIDVGSLAGQRVERLTVKVGANVKEGEVLGQLDTLALRRQEVAVARAQLDEAKARRDSERTAAASRTAAAAVARDQAAAEDHQIDAQRKQIALLERNLELARKDFARTEGLSTRVISAQERERQGLAVRKAEAELDAAKATLTQLVESDKFRKRTAEAQFDVAVSGQAQVVASTEVGVLEQQLDLAEQNRDRSNIVSPIAGTVLAIRTRQGESITTQPILQIADLSRMVCIAEVDEADISRVRPGQSVLVTANAFAGVDSQEGALKGTVESVGRMIHAPRRRSLDPLAPTDRHVFEVRVSLDEAGSRRAAQFVEMQVDVRISVSDSPSP